KESYRSVSRQASRDARERRERARADMPMLDRAFALNMQTSLYALGSHSQVILRRIRTLPFQNNFGSNIVVIIQWQNMEMRMGYIEACGQHSNLLRLINRFDYSSHPFDHEH